MRLPIQDTVSVLSVYTKFHKRFRHTDCGYLSMTINHILQSIISTQYSNATSTLHNKSNQPIRFIHWFSHRNHKFSIENRDFILIRLTHIQNCLSIRVALVRYNGLWLWSLISIFFSALFTVFSLYALRPIQLFFNETMFAMARKWDTEKKTYMETSITSDSNGFYI